jgi:hypothetical protein
MLKKTMVALLATLMILVLFNCKKKSQVKGVNLDVSFSEEKLSDDLITDLKFTWRTDSEFVKMSEDFNVFVHFWHGNSLLFWEDYVPEVPTSTWEVDEEYQYSKQIYIPAFIDEFDPDFKGEETLKLSVGFFSPYDESGGSKQLVMEKKIKVFPPPLDTPEIIYEDGWYNLETDPDSFLKQWRWTAKKARCIIDNPHRDALLVIKGGVNKGVFHDQKVIFMLNDLIFDEFIAEDSYFEKTYNIEKERLGEGDEFYLTLATDKSFIPAEILPDSRDERELGFQISFLYFR